MSKKGSLKHQIKQAIHNHYGNGQYGTVRTHLNRLLPFVTWLKEEVKIRDLNEIDESIVVEFGILIASAVEEDNLAIVTGQNYLSSFNTLLLGLHGDSHLTISPSGFVGSRSQVRKVIPKGMDVQLVEAAAQAMRDNGYGTFADFTYIARNAGFRQREIVSADFQRIITTARNNKIRIMEGTKGGTGRYTERWVEVNDFTLDVISDLADLQGNRKNLIPEHLERIQFIRQFYRQWCRVRDDFDLGRFHDLRAAFACDRFEELTGFKAPVFKMGRPPRNIERLARRIISPEIGHYREDVCSSYIGGY